MLFDSLTLPGSGGPRAAFDNLPSLQGRGQAGAGECVISSYNRDDGNRDDG